MEHLQWIESWNVLEFFEVISKSVTLFGRERLRIANQPLLYVYYRFSDRTFSHVLGNKKVKILLLNIYNVENNLFNDFEELEQQMWVLNDSVAPNHEIVSF